MSLPLSQSDEKFIERIRRLVQFWDRLFGICTRHGKW